MVGIAAEPGYGDCSDVRASVYPGGDEICDAQFNNCDDPLNPLNPDTSGVYTGVVGDCFCPSTDCEIYDSNNVPQCVDASGATCFPVDNVDNADPTAVPARRIG